VSTILIRVHRLETCCKRLSEDFIWDGLDTFYDLDYSSVISRSVLRSKIAGRLMLYHGSIRRLVVHSAQNCPHDLYKEISNHVTRLRIVEKSDADVQKVLFVCNASKMESLDISGRLEIHHIVSDFLARGCPNLTSLSVLSQGESNENLRLLCKAIMSARPPLKRLELSLSSGFDDIKSDLSQAVVSVSSQLEQLGFFGQGLEKLFGSATPNLSDPSTVSSICRKTFGIPLSSLFLNGISFWEYLVSSPLNSTGELYGEVFNVCFPTTSFAGVLKAARGLTAGLERFGTNSFKASSFPWLVETIEVLQGLFGESSSDVMLTQLLMAAVSHSPSPNGGLIDLCKDRVKRDPRFLQSLESVPSNLLHKVVRALLSSPDWLRLDSFDLNGQVNGSPFVHLILDNPIATQIALSHPRFDFFSADRRGVPTIWCILERARFAHVPDSFVPLFEIFVQKYESSPGGTKLNQIFHLVSRSGLETLLESTDFKAALVPALSADWTIFVTDHIISFCYKQDDTLRGLRDILKRHQSHWAQRPDLPDSDLIEIADRIWAHMIGHTEDYDVIRFIENISRHFPILPQRISLFVNGKADLPCLTPKQTMRARLLRHLGPAVGASMPKEEPGSVRRSGRSKRG
jgi:hypothetical protein